MKSHSICNSNDALVASIDPFLIAKAGDVALSPFATLTKVVPLPNGAAQPGLEKEITYQTPKKRCYNAHQSPNITCYIFGVGSLNKN